MPLFGVQFAPQSNAFQQGVAQGAQMAQSALGLQEKRRQFDALAPLRQAQSRIANTQAHILERTAQSDIDATNAQNQADIEGAALGLNLLGEQVLAAGIANDQNAFNLELAREQRDYNQRLLDATVRTAETEALQARVEYDEFVGEDAVRARALARTYTGRQLKIQLDTAQENLQAARASRKVAQFQQEQAEVMAAVNATSDEAFVAGWPKMREGVSEELRQQVDEILANEELPLRVRGQAARTVIQRNYQDRQYAFARSHMNEMREINRLLTARPELLTDGMLRQIQRLQQMTSGDTPQYAEASETAQLLLSKLRQYDASENLYQSHANMRLQIGAVAGLTFDKTKLPEDRVDQMFGTGPEWLEAQQDKLDDLREDGLDEFEAARWLIDTLSPFDIDSPEVPGEVRKAFQNAAITISRGPGIPAQPSGNPRDVPKPASGGTGQPAAGTPKRGAKDQGKKGKGNGADKSVDVSSAFDDLEDPNADDEE